MADNLKCAHPACTCVPPEGETYCSTMCQDAKDLTELACTCEHTQCAGTKLRENVA